MSNSQTTIMKRFKPGDKIKRIKINSPTARAYPGMANIGDIIEVGRIDSPVNALYVNFTCVNGWCYASDEFELVTTTAQPKLNKTLSLTDIQNICYDVHTLYRRRTLSRKKVDEIIKQKIQELCN